MGYDGRCYYFSNGTRNWNESLEFCSSLDASLVIIKTKSDLEIINRYKEHFYYWIGLAKGAEGWRWVDGSPFTNDIITLENEAPNLNCGYLNTEKIVTIACESLRRWICIRDVNPTFGPSRAAS
ncbi:killer cell lectin-like receptor subfamily G member 1 [Alligator sinensis]|uniref:Killer cell lectin-like receptor subfamily G member 1 n=1 Tax=Alligator sinensis TaxID=38654 RepID=A0A1U8DPF8_ALLSI|nr:killer cell lectin-like receptor subfamily G member 1 [Alligator sinensis]